jgi:hypothetical protein
MPDEIAMAATKTRPGPNARDYSQSGNGAVCRCYAPPMPYVIAAPEVMTASASDLVGSGSALDDAHVAAATSTVALVPAAADEVSVGIARLFSRYAENFQGLAGKAAAFHEQFALDLKAGAVAYGSAEAVGNAKLFNWFVDHVAQLELGVYQAVPPELRRAFGPIVQNIRGLVSIPLIVVGFFGVLFVGVPIAIALGVIEYFIGRLGSLLP